MLRTLRITALLVVCAAGSLFAQDTPAVFVHGFKSHADTWAEAAAALPQRFAIDARTPDPDWNATFEDQANYLQQTLGSLPSTTLAIGHSNGGLVSRQWSRTHGLGAILTIGTPHGGAPLVNHLPDWLDYNLDVITLANIAGANLGWLNSDWWWLASSMYSLLKTSGDIAAVAWWQASVGIGVDTAIPVVREMAVGSPFITAIANDAGREAATIPYRIGIANTTTNYRTAGPFRLLDDPELYRDLIWGVAGSLDYYGLYLIAYSDPQDFDAQNSGWSILDLSTQLWNFEELWCRAVSDPRPLSVARCEDNDVIVPTWSQQFPGGVTLFRTGNFTHPDETTESIDWLSDALANFVHVPARGASTGGGSTGGGGETGGGSSGGGAATPGQVTFYEHNDFYGASFSASASAEFVGGDWNDRITSLRIPAGMSVVLYQDWYYGGQSVTLSGDVPDLRRYGGPGADGTWNDAISSFAVVGTATGGDGGGGGGSTGSMQSGAAVRGCSDYVEWSPIFQPTASACLSYCSQNNANACEWHQSGSCYVEFGTSCYVESGYAGWSAAVISRAGTGLRPSGDPRPDVGGPAAQPVEPRADRLVAVDAEHDRSRGVLATLAASLIALALWTVGACARRRFAHGAFFRQLPAPFAWAPAATLVLIACALARRGLPVASQWW
jgi:hypothetical protein